MPNKFPTAHYIVHVLFWVIVLSATPSILKTGSLQDFGYYAARVLSCFGLLAPVVLAFISVLVFFSLKLLGAKVARRK